MKRYLPFTNGVYTTTPGLIPLRDEKIFDVDENYPEYIANKNHCRSEGITKYYCEHNFNQRTNRAVTDFLFNRIGTEYSGLLDFDGDSYDSLFDGICSHLQEDVAVIQLDGDKDWLTAIHLCSPNHWDPRTKIGRPFNEIHTPVPNIERTVKNYQVMLKMIVEKDIFTRFAWGVATDTRLNHHPEPPPGYNATMWKGRRAADETSEFFVRVERQNLIGLKDVNAFIFTIRTYFYPINELNGEEKISLAKAVNSMSNESLDYKGMNGFKGQLMSLLAE
jgi:dimethylamine monooxygenase subunit A